MIIWCSVFTLLLVQSEVVCYSSKVCKFWWTSNRNHFGSNVVWSGQWMSYLQLEEEIATLRSVLDAKTREAGELKQKLGITPLGEFKDDFKHGIQVIRESETLVFVILIIVAIIITILIIIIIVVIIVITYLMCCNQQVQGHSFSMLFHASFSVLARHQDNVSVIALFIFVFFTFFLVFFISLSFCDK